MGKEPSRKFSLLFVDDEIPLLSSMKRIFHKAAYELHTAVNGVEALGLLKRVPIDAALVDLKMPEMDGMELLEQMRSSYPTVRVVILTGHGGVQDAVHAMKLGAVDFLQKPFEPEKLEARIGQLYHMWRLEQENRRLKQQVRHQFDYDQLIGNSTAMLGLKKMIVQLAGVDAAILIQGDTGTGKELVAQAIHYHSPRSGQAFVPVDCGGINETVIGSELFGHVKGAFTGAHESTRGLFRAADKGTLFLDEVGELPPSMQVKLLRVIQEKEVRPVGASQSYPVDVRIVAATNRDLEQEVANGHFRQDLFYRLNVVAITTPPLSDRKEDIALLSRHFVQKFITPASTIHRVSPEAMTYLTNYDWPGNVRELENVIRRAVAIGQEDQIMPCDLPDSMNGGNNNRAALPDDTSADSLAAYEFNAIRNALTKCAGHRKKAAQLLGIGEATLYRKLNKYRDCLQ
jgi:DNA-binding NtrC family response regulator